MKYTRKTIIPSYLKKKARYLPYVKCSWGLKKYVCDTSINGEEGFFYKVTAVYTCLGVLLSQSPTGKCTGYYNL